MSDSFYKSEMDREMLLNIEIQKQNLKSLPEKFKAQKKTVSPVTQQMINDYKLQFRDMYKRGKDGTDQFYKFLIPEALPTLEPLDDNAIFKLKAEGKLKIVFPPIKIADANNKLIELINDYKDTDSLIQEKYEDIKRYNKEINELSTDRISLMNINDSLDKELDLTEINLKSYDEIYDDTKKKKIVNLFAESEFKRNRKMFDDFNKNYDMINDIDDELKNLINQVNLAEKNIVTLTNDNINNKTKIDTLKNQLEVNDENKLFNEKVLYTIEQNNKKKLADYAKTLRIMNEGQISIEQAPGESETDFLKRLADVALIEEDLTRASLFNTNEFKKNLKTIIKSEWKIENLVKSFNNDNQFLLNKTFAGFKKYFNEVYGSGNQNLEVEDYISLINAYLDSEGPKLIKKGKTKEGEIKGETKEEIKDDGEEETKADEPELPDDDTSTLAPAPAPAPEPAVAVATPAPAVAVATFDEELPEVKADKIELPPIPTIPFEGLNNVFYDLIQDNKTMIIQELSPVMKLLYLRHDETSVYYSDDNVKYNSFSPVFGSKIPLTAKIEDVFFNGSVLSFNNYTAFFTLLRPYEKKRPKKGEQRGRIQKPAIEMFVKLLERMGVQNRGDLKGSGLTGKALQGLKKPERNKKTQKTRKMKKKPVVQKGASVKTVPTHCQFGKTIILLNKLYQNNILSVKDSNNINIQGIPNSKVDDKFVNIILGICNNEEVNKKDIDALSEKDFILFNVLIKKAGLTKKYNIDNTKAIKLLKDRLELVEGEILAGNTNEEIKKELYDIVFKLANLGATSLSNSRKYYKDVVKLMF